MNAQVEAIQEGNVLPDACPDCRGTAVMSLRNDNAIYCHLCEADLYMQDCMQCGRSDVITHDGPGEMPTYCDKCLERAEDQYIQMQIDINRGK